MARGARGGSSGSGTLPRSFFARDADIVARDLLGRHLVHVVEGQRLVCRIVETEAYFGPAGRNPHLAQRLDMPMRLRQHLMRHGDPASHSFVGVTDRNRIMYGPPGFWYVYLIYGMHECVNVVTGPEDPAEPQAVLLRAGEPVEGLGAMVARRGLGEDARPTQIASGPGKLAKAMGVTRALYGADACSPGAALHVEEGDRPVPAARVEATPRIGVVGAEHLRLRYVEKGSPFSSRARRT